jgi:hypothetical protein
MAVGLSALCTGRPSPPPLQRLQVLISVRGLIDPRAIVWLERLGQLKNSITSLGIKSTPIWLSAYCLNQLCYHVDLSVKSSTLRNQQKQTANWWEAMCSSELLGSLQTTQSYNLEYHTLHSHCSENFKSNTAVIVNNQGFWWKKNFKLPTQQSTTCHSSSPWFQNPFLPW